MAIKELKVFVGSAHKEFGEEVCRYLGIEPGRSKVSRFRDGELKVKIEENVRGVDTFIIQPTLPPGDNIIELLLFIDALKRASARRITAVIPYYGYARQDRKDEPRVPISARLMADLLTVAGASRVLALDLHADQIQGFFSIPVDNLNAIPVYVEYLKSVNIKDAVVVAPDIGSANKARNFARSIGQFEIAIVDKRREKANEAKAFHLVGNVEGKHAIIFDDIIDTGGTLLEASRVLKENGAVSIWCIATHAILSGNAVDKLNDSYIENIIVTNSLPIREKITEKFTILSIAHLMGEAIRRIHNEESISSLFII